MAKRSVEKWKNEVCAPAKFLSALVADFTPIEDLSFPMTRPIRGAACVTSPGCYIGMRGFDRLSRGYERDAMSRDYPCTKGASTS